MANVTLITGITRQDGAYLAEFLLNKGCEVHSIKRRASSFNTDRIGHLYQDPHEKEQKFILHYGDLTDSMKLVSIIQQIQTDEIYNLAAQSHVAVSFECPEYTADTVAWVHFEFWMQFVFQAWRKKPVTIRPLLLSFTGKYRRFLKQKKHQSIHAYLMR